MMNTSLFLGKLHRETVSFHCEISSIEFPVYVEFWGIVL